MAADADLAIVAAGIVGLAHALASPRRGWKVIDRDAQANGASDRNFGSSSSPASRPARPGHERRSAGLRGPTGAAP
ncbi:hypothetical protein [Bosea sp. 2KB_26]|uniref:hypothetical protein n=1 Tax=Bosea sp. 2KB_26 TaxID=3237475 RepID=UPI003F8FF33D